MPEDSGTHTVAELKLGQEQDQLLANVRFLGQGQDLSG
jgi:hypothetical protein